MTAINQEPILTEEIIFDIDKFEGDVWELYDKLICCLSGKDYHLELWYADGQRSPHLYVFVRELAGLSPEVREEYKRKFLLKYCSYADLNLAEEGRLISAKGKAHFKYGTIKRKLGEWNVGK